MEKFLLLLAMQFVFFSSFVSQAEVWQPKGGPVQMALWPDHPPGKTEASGKTETLETDHSGLVAGKPYDYISNVSVPTMTVYPPKTANNGAAIVVFPGGGFSVLAIDLEGTEICDWVNSKGMTCILLKYRVPHSANYWDEACKCHINPKTPAALQDAERTLRMVRANAKKWKIDPQKIGVIGFSAGGYLVAQTSTRFHEETYPAIDEVDKLSARPDFAIALYPGHLWVADSKPSHFDPETKVTSETPATLLIQATDDPMDEVKNSLSYYEELHKAKVKVEMHLFAEGGHAFGLRPTKLPATHWPDLAEAWLKTLDILK